MNLEGDLDDIDLTGLIQLMSAKRRDGGIVLERPGELGVLYFAGGEIVDAAAGPARGQEAVYQLLAWSEGSFQVKKEMRSPARSIWASCDELLLEGMHKLDENRYQDNTEDDFVALLSALEQLLVKLRGEPARHQGETAVTMVSELTNQVADFHARLPERNGGTPTLRSLLAAASRGDPALPGLVGDQRHVTALALQALCEERARGEEGPRAVRRVLGVLLDVVERCFLLIIDRFPSAEPREHWSETCRLFVAEWRQSLKEVPF